MTTTDAIGDLIIEGIQNRKGHNITIVDLSGIENAAASKFIIAEGTSTTQTSSIAESVEETVRENCGEKPFGIIGENTGEWVVMDYGDVWVHIFLPPSASATAWKNCGAMQKL